jgi:hypothetical protein
MDSGPEILVHDSSDWEQLVSLLPSNWETKSRELNALRRFRGFDSPNALLRTLMLHLLDGRSLRETVIRAREGNIADVSDVALLKRLRSCGEWFRWMAQACREDLVKPVNPTRSSFRFILVDATHVSEPGATGTDWRIHYAFDLDSLECRDLKVTDKKVGETFKNYIIEPGAVYMDDRGYWHNQGIAYLRSKGAHAMVRMGGQARTFIMPDGRTLNLKAKLRKLHGKDVGDWPISIKVDDNYYEGRICAIKKSKVAAKKAEKDIRAICSRKATPVTEDRLEASRYICIFTTLSQQELSATDVLEAYRSRWQIELCFKRMKSLLGLGHLPKQDPKGAKAWIHGKLFCAMLIERFVSYADRFSPWGYPVQKNTDEKAMQVA